jgi:hypothetical protein
MYEMELDQGGSVEFAKKQSDNDPNEMDCIIRATIPNQGRSTITLRVPKHWC